MKKFAWLPLICIFGLAQATLAQDRGAIMAAWGLAIGAALVAFLGVSLFWNRRLAREIAERKQVEATLRESELNFRTLTDSGPALIWTSGSDTRCNYFNTRWFEFTGRSFEQEAGNGWTEGVHPDDFQHCLDTYVGAFEKREPFRMEYRLRRHDGEFRWLQNDGCPRVNASGEFIGYIGYCVDITERKQAEEALRGNERILHIQNETLQSLNEEYQAINEELAQTNDHLTEATRRLTESEQKFREIFNNANDAIYLMELSADGLPRHFVEVNEVACAMLGYTRAEFLTLSPKEISVGNIAQTLPQMMEPLLAQKQMIVQTTHRAKDGRQIPVEINSHLVEIMGDARILSVARDITERKRTEAALRESERKLDSILQGMVDGVVMTDPTGQIIYANRGADRILNVRRDDLLSTYYYSRAWRQVDEHGQPYPHERLPLAIALGERRSVESLEHGIIASNGEWKWLSVNAVPLIDADGQLYGAAATFRDMTARKRMETELRETRDYLENLLNYANAPIIVWDPQLRITRFNAAFERLSGYAADEVIGEDFSLLFPLASRAASLANITRAVGGEYWETVEIPIRRKDGGIRLVLWNSANIYDQNRVTLQATIAQGMDITDRKHAEEELLRAKNSAEAANRAKSRFLASMSHELRTPLNGILGYAQILTRDSALTAKQREQILTIERSGQHLLNLINDILDLAKVEAGKLDVIETDFALPTLLQEVGALIQMRSASKGVTFRLEYTTLPTVVHGAEHRLRQVLLNLLGNAVKFTERGQITLRASALSKMTDSPPEMGKEWVADSDSPPGRGKGWVADSADSAALDTPPQPLPGGEFADSPVIRFEVEDTGIGIAADELANIFEPFRQAGTQEYRVQGAGLGLAISRNLVRLMGSELQARSETGVGSVFWFDLSLTEIAAPPAIALPSIAHINGVFGTPPTILIVDDEAVNRAYLRDALTSVGIRVIEAANGREGLTLAQECHPQAVITDIVMPEMDGLELIRRLRQTPELQAIIIITASASAYPEDQQACRDAGSQAFLSKPIDIEQLFARLHELLAVQWVYREECEAANTAPNIADLARPPASALERLLDLARMGDILELRQQMATLAEAEAEWQPFLQPLQQLAQQFRLVDVRVQLEAALSQANTPDLSRLPASK